MRLASELSPDVIVLDVRMPHLDGLEVTRRIRAQHPSIHILILSAYDDDEYVFPLLEAGADGYLLKTTKGKELVRAIEEVCAGTRVVDPQLTSKLVDRVADRHAATGIVEPLTQRELEVLQQVAQGLSNKFEDWGIQLMVEDDGPGFDLASRDSESSRHLGLEGMRERAQLCGGRLIVKSEPGEGTVISLRIKIDGN